MKYSTHGKITVECKAFEAPEGLRRGGTVAVEIVVTDTGRGIPPEKLESIFREFEQVESAAPRTAIPALGLGLAVVARIVEQLGGQLRVDSKVNKGSRFSFLAPFVLAGEMGSGSCSASSNIGCGSRKSSGGNDIHGLVEALVSNHTPPPNCPLSNLPSRVSHVDTAGSLEIPDPNRPLRAVKVDPIVATLGHPYREGPTIVTAKGDQEEGAISILPRRSENASDTKPARLRVLIVEVSLSVLIRAPRLTCVQDNAINSKILGKRMLVDGHTVAYAANGQECVDTICLDHEFDCILMDIQYVDPPSKRDRAHRGPTGCPCLTDTKPLNVSGDWKRISSRPVDSHIDSMAGYPYLPFLLLYSKRNAKRSTTLVSTGGS